MKQKVNTLVDLKKACEKAVQNGDEYFSIDGLDFVTGYVKDIMAFIKQKNVWNMDAPIRSVFKWGSPRFLVK